MSVFDKASRSNFQEAISTPRVVFVCGSALPSNPQRFLVHTGVASRVSQMFYAMLNNGLMSESRTGIVKLPTTEPETFDLFSGWANMVAYETTIPGGFSKLEAPLKAFCRGCKSADPTTGLNGLYCSMRCYRINAFKNTFFCEHCQVQRAEGMACEDCIPSFNFTNSCAIPESGDLARSGDDADLTQFAKLFVFADMYMVEELKDYAIARLHNHLNTVMKDEIDQCLPAVVALIRYVYNNSSAKSMQGKPGACTLLRSLVLSFVLDRMLHVPSITEMVEEIGDFADDYHFQSLQPQE